LQIQCGHSHEIALTCYAICCRKMDNKTAPLERVLPDVTRVTSKFFLFR
jgi:hypothetical protein